MAQTEDLIIMVWNYRTQTMHVIYSALICTFEKPFCFHFGQKLKKVHYSDVTREPILEEKKTSNGWLFKEPAFTVKVLCCLFVLELYVQPEVTYS